LRPPPASLPGRPQGCETPTAATPSVSLVWRDSPSRQSAALLLHNSKSSRRVHYFLALISAC
jgi:hypothetical protein